jgi:PTH1 family peptidyl-tRNA hydrolase
MVKLIVALGNPGNEYELTRHNIGWLVADSLKPIEGKNWKQKFKGEFTDFTHKGEKVYVLKPHTYMNLSGESVRALCDFFKIKPQEVIALQDELDLPFGTIHFKKGGGLAGHNGLKSMAQHLGTQDFMRLRIGIGRPDRGSVSNWVLSPFPPAMDIELGTVLKKTSEALLDMLSIGIQKASNKYNKKDFLALN